MVNSHIHSKYSVDSTEEIDDICKEAIKKGLTAIAITDHVCFWHHPNGLETKDLVDCKNEIIKLREKYKGKLKILFGMEISEYHFNPSYEKQALSVGDIDVVLSSLHDDITISSRKLERRLCNNDFKTFSKEQIVELIKNYYKILIDIAKNSDYDVLAHLTYPLRYITCRDKVKVDFKIIEKEIKEILQIIIKRNKALELNTSNVVDKFFMPGEEILKLYREMGGELITLGSDAHVCQKVDLGLKEGKELLKKCGFTKYYYYENRKPIIAEEL